MNISHFECEFHWRGLLEYLLLKTAPVHYRVKPAVLLRLSNCRRSKERGEADSFCSHESEIMAQLKLERMILKRGPADLHILFYDRALLEKQLTCAENRNFLRSRGYGEYGSPEEAVAELKRRFERSGVPHEIGVFLGYPLKDVIGFIGGGEAAPVAGARWRVFGDPVESMKIMTHCRRAEELMRRRVNNPPPKGGILWQR